MVLDEKRARAMATLNEFRKWHTREGEPVSQGVALTLVGLMCEISKADEEELDRMTVRMEELNGKALIKKVSGGI